MRRFLADLKIKFQNDPEALNAIQTLEKKLQNSNRTSPSQTYSFRVFSDGACRGNPGPGSWGTLIENADGETLYRMSGVEMLTTNNQMEMIGFLEGLKRIIDDFPDTQSLNIEAISDSKYLIDGVTKWMKGWKSRGWKKSDKKAPENLAIWKEIDATISLFNSISYTWVKGHAGHPQNEECDRMANQALDDAGF